MIPGETLLGRIIPEQASRRGALRAARAIVCACAVSSCVTTGIERSVSVVSEVDECVGFFARFDAAVNREGVRDASTAVVPGFPYLRTTRFITALSGRAQDDEQRRDWIDMMQETAQASFRKEVEVLAPANFQPDSPSSLGRTREDAMKRVAGCTAVLREADEQLTDYYEVLAARALVPDEYSLVMRVLGLYPVASLPVRYFAHRRRNEFQGWFDTPMDELSQDGRLVTYRPSHAVQASAAAVVRQLQQARRNALGIIRLNQDETERIVATFAPVIHQDQADEYDRLGRVVWDEERVSLDPTIPTVYYYVSHAFYAQEPALQLNYVFWYSARAGPRAPAIERGHMDGLTIRMALGYDGRVLMAEVMNNCGCYHTFFPLSGEAVVPVQRGAGLLPFVPMSLPTGLPGRAVIVRISSGWHQVQGLRVGDVPSDGLTYMLVPYEQIEALPRSDGGVESVFNSAGMLKGSRRPERFILFSMGIPKVGSMRQRGHHAIELIGRAHFDDPELYRRYFRFGQFDE